MIAVILFDAIALLALLVGAFLLIRGRRHTLHRDTRWLLAGLLIATMFNTTSNLLEWTGITAALDPFEDYIELLVPALWGSFIYAVLREQIEQQLRANAARLRREKELVERINEASPAGIVMFDRSGQITFANLRAEQVLGLKRTASMERHYNTPAWRATTEDGSPFPEEELPLVRVLLTGQPVLNVQHAIQWPTGARRLLSINAAPLFDDTGQIDGVVAIVEDITERRRVERELEQHRGQLEQMVRQRTAELEAANEQLRVLSRAKDEFISNVSHELRTPITSIKLHHRLLAMLPEKHAAYMETLVRETRRLEQLVESLLDISRLDQQAIDLDLKPVDLNMLANTCAADRLPLAAEKGLTLSTHLAADLPQVLADAARLEQVLSILLTNALNYTPRGGSVTIATQMQRVDGREWATLSISDTGPGIAPDEQPHIFERFFRGRAGRETGQPGTGLGLAIAQEIIAQHQGHIECSSTGVPGEGVCFTIWLPQAG